MIMTELLPLKLYLSTLMKAVVYSVQTYSFHYIYYIAPMCDCLACEAEARHMYCFSSVVVVGGGSVNFFVFRSFSQKL